MRWRLIGIKVGINLRELGWAEPWLENGPKLALPHNHLS
jgi:hypothetical protein